LTVAEKQQSYKQRTEKQQAEKSALLLVLAGNEQKKI